ncbi:hypothetical protein HUN08_11100 [Gordonia sp. X0973]|uniref:hypothetical protein n=1 Tax=Gordonia sp. X0973 TaxID=2742602 RepID=UPI000F54B8B8|nr:hypothetical protein [Gordonia sp. X0973]QKT07675.1 hypothetical protein HUN08_11100 [Gordonia sp. X0973]
MGRTTDSENETVDEQTASTEKTASTDAEADTDSPLAGADFLAANRRNRAEAKARAQEEAARKARTPGKVAAPTRGASGRSRLVPALIALSAVLAVVAAGVVFWAVRSSNEAAQLNPQSSFGKDAQATAGKYVADVMTYNVDDFGDLDRRIHAVATPGFAEQYIKASGPARKGSAAGDASSQGKAAATGIIELSGKRAVVLVALDQTITSPAIAEQFPDGHLYQSRVRATLVRDGNRWLLDGFDVV